MIYKVTLNGKIYEVEVEKGVTPSFHLLDYQFFGTDCINSFQFYTYIFSSTPNLFS